MEDAINQSLFYLNVKKLPLILFIFLFIFCFCACSSHTQRAAITNIAQPSSLKISQHTVVKGDTLYAIAWQYNLDYKDLAKINDISAPYAINPGQILRLSGVASRLPYGVSRPAVKRVHAAPKVAVKTPYSPVSPKKNRLIKPADEPIAVKTQSVKSSSLVWSWPIRGRIISQFDSAKGLNKGIDIAAKLGEPVHAAADGEVVYSGSGLRGYGKLLIIKHKNSYLSAYAHNSELLAKEGDVVKRGQKVALVGASGVADVKLHFEIRKDGVPVNPVSILPR